MSTGSGRSHARGPYRERILAHNKAPHNRGPLDPCDAEATCRADFVCGGTNTCVAPGTQGTAEEGGACEGDDDCQSIFACGGAGVCVFRDGPAVGEECADGASPCRSDLVCTGGGLCGLAGSPGTGTIGTVYGFLEA